MPEDTRSPPGTLSAAKAWGYARDALAVGVIPLLLWGMTLEVGNAQRDILIEQLQERDKTFLLVEIARLERRIEDNADIDDKVQDLAVKQATLEGKLDTANGRLSEIKNLLR